MRDEIKIGSYAVISLDTYVSYPSAIKNCVSLVLARSHLPQSILPCIKFDTQILFEKNVTIIYYDFRSVSSSHDFS